MKIIIKQKMSGTGSIYDLASEMRDRVINMGNAFEYAVVGPSYYNAGSTRHKSAEAALKKLKSWSNDGYNGFFAVDLDGLLWDVNGDELVRCYDHSDEILVATS